MRSSARTRCAGSSFERVRFARRAYEARLVALQARVEPRFLFDTLDDVEALLPIHDPALGARILDDLIVHLRAALPAIEESSVPRSPSNWSSCRSVGSTSRNAHTLRRPAAGRHARVREAPLDARMPPMVLLPQLVRHAVEAGRETRCAGDPRAGRPPTGTADFA